MVVCQLPQLGREPHAVCQAESSEQGPPAIGLRPKEITLFIHICTSLQQHGNGLIRSLSQEQAKVEAVLQLLTSELKDRGSKAFYKTHRRLDKASAREPGARRSMASMDFTDPMQQPA